MNLLKAWWKNHKVKTLGLLAMLVAAAQSNFSEIQSFIPQNRQGLVLFAFGMLAAIFGFMNSNP